MEISTIRLLAKLPTIAAYAYKKSVGQPFLYPDNSLGLVENFLRMTFGFPAEPTTSTRTWSARSTCCSSCTPTTSRTAPRRPCAWSARPRRTCSPSISAGINALFGPLHGGANSAVLEMLEKIQNDGGDVKAFVNKVKNKEDGVRLMGFGHRVYKNYDPRAAIIKKTADEILDKLGGDDQLLDIAKQLEEDALSDEYFVSRKLYPNVDFYTGLIYRAMGFPTKFFTVLFALGRLPGWIAHWREMIKDPATKIGRPRQIYTGPTERDFHRDGRSRCTPCLDRDACLPSLTDQPSRPVLRARCLAL